jgi:DeoR/GlpR family transcriptional regulator of sugar metabolism
MERADLSRREQLLEMLQAQTTASISEMAIRFQVSEMTIRRDVERLSQTGAIIRVPGGARIARPVTFEKTFAERSTRMAEAKNRIGSAAAALIQPGESVVLDSGTTTLCVARHLRAHQDIVVVTFSIAVLEELAGVDSVRVELTGGTYRASSHDLIGNAVSDGLTQISADKVIFGAAAVSRERGIMVFDPDAPRALLKAGRQRILVVDSSKVDSEALYFFCKFDACDLLITDSGISRPLLAELRELVKVQVA